MIQALRREDLFTVVCDVVMTDSVRYADVVLPACSHFEYADLYPSYGHHFLQRATPVIPPVGDTLPNTEIFRRLAQRFGFTEPAFQATDAQLMDEAVALDDPRLHGIRPSQLPLDQALPMHFNGNEAMLLQTTFPATPSGKIELYSATLDKKYGQPLPRYRPVLSSYPLTFITPSSDQRTTSTFGNLRYSDDVWIDMHPQDAQVRGLSTGCWYGYGMTWGRSICACGSPRTSGLVWCRRQRVPGYAPAITARLSRRWRRRTMPTCVTVPVSTMRV